ncbi:MAG: M14 family metallopeptidase [Lachnospiraceae bacterium]|nr:M14 family metallopeptidase [Lachnospiraceae bacterium]
MEELAVGTLRAGKGQKVSGFVQVEGTDFSLPVTLICGEKEGETVLISGGVHSAEYVGIQAAMELADELEPWMLRGNVVVIRLMNPTGFEHRTMSLVYEDGKNLNRVFPGSPLGTTAERIAYAVEEKFLRLADYYIDLHCGDGYESLVPYVYYLGAAEPKVAKKSREMAEAVQVDYLVGSESLSGGAYNRGGSMGIPGILLERGQNGLWSREEVEADKRDVKNVLRVLKILEGPVESGEKKPAEVSPVIYENAAADGCWYPEKQPGDVFQKGEVLGRIRDYFGKELQVCRARQDGVILYETSSLCIMKDTPMVAYGYWKGKEEGA